MHGQGGSVSTDLNYTRFLNTLGAQDDTSRFRRSGLY